MAILAVSILLLIVIVLLVTEIIPIDQTAVGILVVLLVTGILTPGEAIAGFANPAPITVAVLFVVSEGLIRTGSLDFITERIVRLTGGSPRRLLLVSLLLVGGFSSFLNNTPVVVLFIPVILSVCCRYSLSPSQFLLPISFISILAGMSTLIGTSTNIIVSDLAVQSGMEPIAMFELSLLGMPLALAGAAFLYFASPRLLGDHKEPISERGRGEQYRYISELRVPASSPLCGRSATAELGRRFPEVELFEVLRGELILDPQREDITLAPEDLLLVKGTAPELAQILDRRYARLVHREEGPPANPHDTSSVIVELLVQPNSAAVGRSIPNLLATLDAKVRLLGVKQHWKHYGAEKVRDLRLAVGDIMLVQTPLDHLDQLRASDDLLVIEDVHSRIIHRRKAPLAMATFAAMILVTTFTGVHLLVTSLAAMLLMLLTGCLSQRQAYRALDGRILLLIIGTLALGAALTKTGAADLYAENFLRLFAGASPAVVLSAFILLTSLLSVFLSNNSTAVLILPIALASAAALGVDPRPFVIGVCFGASACYASPIGYQTNLLVYGPGGYRFADYLKLGLPLNIFVWIAASIFVPILWPL